MDDTRKRTYMTALHTVLADEETHFVRAQRKVESLGNELKTSMKKVKTAQLVISGID